ncbi:MAG: hypothetical protein ACLR85_10840 [Veillonella sp.]
MANWQGAKVTNKGTALIAKVTAGNTKLNITRVAFGSGNLTNIENATRLVREIDNAEIITKVQKNNTCTVTVRLTNANFTTAQNISEIGIFATDPDEGEILFAGMVDANPDFVQAASSSTLVAKTVTMGIGYSNSDNVTISLSNTMWVTAEEVLTMISDELRKYGNNTHRINDAVVAANTAQTITALTDMIGNRIKAITGESTWVGNPANNIKGIQSSITDLLSLVASLPVTNIKDFNKQVISALDQEKLTALGVKYNFDNPNAWSISFGKLFGGLIIQGGYTYHAGAKSVLFNTLYKKAFGVLLMPTVAPELTSKPPHMVLFNNDGVGGVKNDSFNAIAYYDVLNRDYNDNVAFFWLAFGV